MKNKRYEVVAIHYGTKCNKEPRCKFCYCKGKDKLINPKDEKEQQFFFDLLPYLSKMTKQIALGSYGEPLMYPNFVKDFSKAAKKKGLIVNLTTNGKANFLQLSGKGVFRNITLVSISFNDELIQSCNDLKEFSENVKWLKNYTPCLVGCNLLINKNMTKDKGKGLVHTVNLLNKIGVDRIFCLYPKNCKRIDILPSKGAYNALSAIYKNFFVDDLTKMILSEKRYKNWKKPCHFGKSIISISPDGKVYGCSFDKHPLLVLDKPQDIQYMQNITGKERHNCPYLK